MNQHASRFTALPQVRNDRRVRARRNRIDGHELRECLFDRHLNVISTLWSAGIPARMSAKREQLSAYGAFAGRDARAPLSPQFLLQFIETFDDLFLQQMLALGYDRFPVNDHFADRCPRSRKYNCR